MCKPCSHTQCTHRKSFKSSDGDQLKKTSNSDLCTQVRVNDHIHLEHTRTRILGCPQDGHSSLPQDLTTNSSPCRRAPLQGLSPPFLGLALEPHCGLGYKLKFNFIRASEQSIPGWANNAGQGASLPPEAVIHLASPALVPKLLELHFPTKFMVLAASGA